MASVVNNLAEFLVVQAIFENPKSAAKKVLEIIKVWTCILPSREVELENAAKNVINFQGTKGYLTLLDFDTAIVRTFGEDAKNAFKLLRLELQTAMGKPAHEIKMDPAE